MSNSGRGSNAWWSLSSKPKTPRIEILEIEKGVPTRGDSEALASLKDHPGILALINRLKLQRSYLESRLVKERHETLRDADILQLGIYWTRFVESQIAQATGFTQDKIRPVAEEELAEFERVRAFLESVGPTKTENQ